MVLFAATAALLLTQAKPLEWKVATLPGGFTVDVPVSLTRLPRDFDGPFVTDSWYVNDGTSSTYAATITSSTDKSDKTPPHRVLGQLINELTNSPGDHLLLQRDIVLKGWPGIESEFADKSGQVTQQRAFVVNGKLFQATATIASKNADRSSSTRYVYSMNLPKSAGQGPQKSAGPEFAVYSLGGISVRLPEKPEKEAVNLGSESPIGALTRYQSAYGNRVYLCLVIEIPDEAMDETEGHEKEILAMLNDKMLEGMGAKGQTDRNYQFGKVDVFSSSSKVALNFGARVDSFITGQRAYSLVAVTPRVLQESEEVKAFFSSMKLG